MIELLLAVAPAPDVGLGLGVGGVLLTIGCGGFWGSLHLRGRTYSRHKGRVDLAHSSLAELAVRKLRVLADKLDEVLPEAAEAFDPLSVIVDPAVVQGPADDAIRILKQRARLGKRFDMLLDACTASKVVGIAFPLFVLASTAAYFFLFASPQVWQMLWFGTIVVGLASVVILAIYGRLNSLVEQSIEMAGEAPAAV